MKSFGSSIGILVPVFVLLSACKRDEPGSQNTPSPSATATTTALAVAASAAPAAAAPSGTSAKTDKGVCPYPRRCTDACVKAHTAALEACSAEWKVLEQAVSNVKEQGECTAHCLKSKNTALCVGPETKAECDCVEKCLEGTPPAVREKGEPYLRCYANKVAAACY